MIQRQSLINGRRKRTKPSKGRAFGAAFDRPNGVAGSELAYPGYIDPSEEGNRRTLISGSLAFLVHLSGFAILAIIAGLAPVIEERIIAVQILNEEPPPPPEPSPAPRALAERRSLDYAPAVQAVSPQVVNPHVIADAAPAVQADALQMDAVSAVAAPAAINHSSLVVERVSAVNSVARATASAVDVARVASPVVRGPTRVQAPARPSVGPRRVEAAAVGVTTGTGPLQIGNPNGSSVREGVLSDRDVIGSPEGALVVAVDTTIGSGFLRGDGGTGTSNVSTSACLKLPAVQSYLIGVKNRTVERWQLPPGVDAGRKVTLKFRLDAAGSANKVSIERTDDNALGASAVDALRAAAPFPPMPEAARCLARVPIVGTFSNPVGG